MALFSKAAAAQTRISIDSVGAHIGDSAIVCTRVYGIKTTDKVTFINMGAPFPNAPLTVVVFAKDLPALKDKLDTLITDKQVCVTGKLITYRGKTEIIVSRTEDIVVQP